MSRGLIPTCILALVVIAGAYAYSNDTPDCGDGYVYCPDNGVLEVERLNPHTVRIRCSYMP